MEPTDMPVHITEISLDGLPPQPEIHLRPRRVNLIYGRNEHGKTRLVEFILSSLLRSSSKMALRPVEAAGFVTVSGLPDAEETRFNPRSRSKLEDYLPAPDAGLPPQLARLLVVKGLKMPCRQHPRRSGPGCPERLPLQPGCD
jgi:hypothetical protein